MKTLILIIAVLIIGFIGCENHPNDSTKTNIIKEDNNNVCVNMMYYDNGTLKLFKDNAHAIHIIKQGREWFFVVEKPEFDTLLKININQIEVLLADGKGITNCE